MKYWHILYLFTFFSEKMNLIPNQTISAATLFEVFQWWINEKEMPVVCLWSTCIRVTTIWIKILLLCSNLACTIITSATKTNLKSLHNYSNLMFSSSSYTVFFQSFFPQNISLLSKIVTEAHANLKKKKTSCNTTLEHYAVMVKYTHLERSSLSGWFASR